MDTYESPCGIGCDECGRDREEKIICMQAGLAGSLSLPMEVWVSDYSLLYRAFIDRWISDFEELRSLVHSASGFIRDFWGPTEKWIERHIDSFLAYHASGRTELPPFDPESVPKRVFAIMLADADREIAFA